MVKRNHTYEAYAERIAGTLLKLYQNESITKESYMEEFGVVERTFFRDMNRMAGIVERTADNHYRLVKPFQSGLTLQDLKQFAQLTGMDGLFPEFSRSFILAFLHTLTQHSYQVKGNGYEKDQADRPVFIKLEQAIQDNLICRMDYRHKSRVVQPYRMVNFRGIWYLAVVEGQTLKSYLLSQIDNLTVTNESFEPDSSITEQIQQSDTIWFNPDPQQVILKVAPEVAYYFERRKLLPGQELVRDLDEEGLILSCQMSHPNQILPLIRYWVPKMDVISPITLKERLLTELHDYVGQRFSPAETQRPYPV